MREEIDNAIRKPRDILLGLVILFFLTGYLVVFLCVPECQQIAFYTLPLITLLPLVIPFILSFYYPVVAGSILILEFVNIFALGYMETSVFSIRNTPSFLVLLAFLGVFIPVILGIWMIISYYKSQVALKSHSEI
jgi:hypothetical protein